MFLTVISLIDCITTATHDGVVTHVMCPTSGVHVTCMIINAIKTITHCNTLFSLTLSSDVGRSAVIVRLFLVHFCPMCGSYIHVFMSVCIWISLCDVEGGKEREGERLAATKARSPDIIEDDISDYPKDRNLSLSAIDLQLF